MKNRSEIFTNFLSSLKPQHLTQGRSDSCTGPCAILLEAPNLSILVNKYTYICLQKEWNRSYIFALKLFLNLINGDPWQLRPFVHHRLCTHPDTDLTKLAILNMDVSIFYIKFNIPILIYL